LSADPIPADADVLSADGRSAVIDIPGEGTALVDSSMPLFHDGDAVDLGLQRAGGVYEPETSLVGISLPDHAYEPASLNEAGVELSYAPEQPVGGNDGHAGDLISDD